ncbi:NADPH-dependent FMN reductase [Streptomyces sp. NPDC002845]
MSVEPIRLAVIVGSVRDGRFGPTVTSWFVGEAGQREDLELDVIDLADIPLGLSGPTRSPSKDTAAGLEQISPRIESADAYVIVTPEYNHSFPAALKNAIDWHLTQWRAKPVAFVSYGGIAGGLRAVEQLRQVFAELHAVTMRDTVSFHGGFSVFGEDGQPNDPDGCNTAAKTMLDQLTWWAEALRQARRQHPYDA